MQPVPVLGPVLVAGSGDGDCFGVGPGVHGTGLSVGSGTRVGAGDPGTGVPGGTNVGVGAGWRDGAGEALAPVSCVQVLPSQAQSSSDTGTAGGGDPELDGLKVTAGSPPKSSSLSDFPS